MKGVSVIVCCYNSASRLKETLYYLSKQDVPNGVDWEIIVVDNASVDKTREVAIYEWEQFGKPTTLKVVEELEPGLSFAREKGISVAKFCYCLFCDDDNWLREDYVKVSKNILDTHPEVGILGGYGVEVCEVPPPDWFDSVKWIYAVGKKSCKSGVLEGLDSFVAGAGCVIRLDAWNKIKEAGFKSILSDRKGKDLSCGGDMEICYAIRMAGYNIFYSEDLVFKHFLPKERLNWDYVMRSCRGSGKAYFYLEHYLYVLKLDVLNKIPKKFFTLGLVKNLLQQLIKSLIIYHKGGMMSFPEKVHIMTKMSFLRTTIDNAFVSKRVCYNLYNLKKRLS